MTTTQQAAPAFTARVEYAKRDRLRFIGHLDTARLIVRAVRAAGLPARYTSGHSPHLDTSFGPPLALGHTGGAEFFDVRLTEAMGPAAIHEALGAHVPEGIEVRSVRLIPGKAGSLGMELNRAEYVVILPAGAAIAAEAVERFLASNRVVVERKRGGRDKAVNVRQYVERLAMFDEPEGGTRLEMAIVLTPEGSTNPEEVLGALGGGEAAPGVRIHRKRLYHYAAGGEPTEEANAERSGHVS